MLMTQLAASKYRYYRWLLAGAVGLAILLISLYTRYYQEVRIIEQNQRTLATRVIAKLNALLLPAQQQAERTMPMVGQPCESVMPTLRFRAAQNQALRAVLLVQNGVIYCSSLFGPRDYVFSLIFPTMSHSGVQLALRPSLTVAKGTPTLVLWTPLPQQEIGGVLNVFNIDLLSNFLLEPQEPYAHRVALNVGEYSLEYGQREIIPHDTQQQDLQYTAKSAQYPFSISLFGPNARTLALTALPRHIPLALMLSLLAAYVVYLITANRMSLSYYIGHAITHREFRVYCQPIISSDNGRCVGVETLMRWKNKRQGWISPDVFIPLAEQHGLIIPLTRYLMTTVVENLNLFPPRPSFYISINVAAEHFNTVSVIDDIRRIWLPAQPMPSLMLELTERTALSEIQHEQLKTLKEMGIMLAIDDFGTGHSSLSYLKKLSPDVLKIDRGFTAAIGTDAVNATVTDTIITLAQRLKLKLVAEGVETEKQADYLRSQGVNALQGYYFAKPMPINVFPLWLQQYESQQRNLVPRRETPLQPQSRPGEIPPA
ncbi:sensor c-di-GMP phosphodiesterase-like protein [Serratia fonticola]|jgi:sensor c-di-GMP phosphodiesterase-like protein|uniref:cyclic-guanylate-specific phosphodiesterase n=1 Tax=Serratia fonticola TaxID=47917 RepID=A0A542D1Q2_SERFO|nr:EAL domain-containing protein [Serratia fonticola]TQI80973.1 sensor c-di-GMP phosphodiesterase-like protein [Serratia fonticola]TQI97003.1 sensor c-di-GMP phosphodiesterase-like protein [Serratia fonticola]TVZ71498.1 sensor c-di-GMP phosphodiesterase-like protein [Serratia fonticola]